METECWNFIWKVQGLSCLAITGAVKSIPQPRNYTGYSSYQPLGRYSIWTFKRIFNENRMLKVVWKIQIKFHTGRNFIFKDYVVASFTEGSMTETGTGIVSTCIIFLAELYAVNVAVNATSKLSLCTFIASQQPRHSIRI